MDSGQHQDIRPPSVHDDEQPRIGTKPDPSADVHVQTGATGAYEIVECLFRGSGSVRSR